MTSSLFTQRREQLEQLITRYHEQQKLAHMQQALHGLGEKFDYNAVSCVASVTDSIHEYVCAAIVINQARELQGDEKRVVDILLDIKKQCDTFYQKFVSHTALRLDNFEREQNNVFTEKDITTRLEELSAIVASTHTIGENITHERQMFSRWEELLALGEPLYSLDEQAHRLQQSYVAL